MNRQRRSMLKNILDKIETVKNLIENVCDEEQESIDNMPENLQMSDRYAEGEENCDQLMECCDMLDEISETINDIITK